MSRNRLFLIAGCVGGWRAIASLIFGIMLLHKDIASYIASTITSTRATRTDALRLHRITREVADTLADYQEPEARAANGNNEYLRYSNNIVIVGPDGKYPCSIRVET